MKKKQIQKQLLRCIQELEKHPGIYVFPVSVRNIKTFLEGIIYGITLTDSYHENFGLLTEFQNFVGKKLGFTSSVTNYANLIEFIACGFDSKHPNWVRFCLHDMSDEENNRAVKIFFILLHDYLRETYDIEFNQ